MPPASSPTPVQIFGRRDSRPTQKALRFFKERRVPVHFVDVAQRPPAPGELRRFVDRFGAGALVDVEGRRYRELGLAHYRLDDAELIARLLEEPSLIRLPLVRMAQACTVGLAEQAWRGWFTARDGSGGAVSRGER